MIRFYQNLINVNEDATNTVKTDIKRGSFVKKNSETKQLELAKTIDDVDGILDRGVVVDDDVAAGFPCNMYGDSQDLVKAGEFAGFRAMFDGEKIGTTEYVNTLKDDDVKAGKYLTITNGKLDKVSDASKTFIISEGWETQDGHKLLKFRIKH